MVNQISNYMSPKIILLLFITQLSFAQELQDNFEGTGNINTWYGDNCGLTVNFSNPFPSGINTSSQVLRYHDTGGQYANVGFNMPEKLKLYQSQTFSFKIYVSSSGLTGNQNNQVSLKLQNNTLAEPWSTQTEIIKPIVLNQWQVVTFNFGTDNYINLNANSPQPRYRTDFNRVLIQVNGENNNAHVLAFIDDFYFNGGQIIDPIYDQLVWQDEFNVNGAVDQTKWFHQTKLPAGGSWFNGEVQHYTNRTVNSVVNNGNLNLIAQKENFTNQNVTKQYTSARLNSKFAFTYGRVEVRAKLPTGPGTWPAIWTLGKNINEDGAYWQTQGFGTTPWPNCGEIDIMEHWGTNQNYISSAMHTPSSFGNTVNYGGIVIPNVSSTFHVYAVDWYPNRMVFSVDGFTHYIYYPSVQNNNTWPFTQDQYILLNTAILPSILPSFTQSTMEIDYVRVYQSSALNQSHFADKKTLDLFPNPVHDLLQINWGIEKPNDINIFDITGKLMLSFSSFKNENFVIDMSNFKTGIYFLKLNFIGKNTIKKIIKK